MSRLAPIEQRGYGTPPRVRRSPALTPPLRHDLGLRSARFSPDGKWIVTASEDATARIWNVATRQPFGRPFTHRGHVHAAEFNPDSKRVVTASLDRTARIWDVTTSEPLTEPLKHLVDVVGAQSSPDGRCVITVSADRATRVWDVATGHLLFEPILSPSLLNVAVSASTGFRPLVPCKESGLRIWEFPDAPLPVPVWMPDLAEAMAGRRFDAVGRSFVLGPAGIVRARQQLAAGRSTDFYANWARWFFGDRDSRRVSPFVPDTAITTQRTSARSP